jgi:flagellum-specific peptidoglycan hydrolase FlgJ
METGDSSEYPSDYDDALLCYASYILFNQVQKYDNAVAMRNRYEEAVNAIKMKVFYTDRALFMNM